MVTESTPLLQKGPEYVSCLTNGFAKNTAIPCSSSDEEEGSSSTIEDDNEDEEAARIRVYKKMRVLLPALGTGVGPSLY